MNDEKKRLADALAALSAGHHDEPEQEADHAERAPASEEPPEVESTAAPPRPSSPARPATPGESAPVAKIRPRSRPTTPSPARVAPPTDDVPAEPLPARPASPGRPVAPLTPAASETLPAPPTPPGVSSKPRRRAASKPVFASLAFKRALIPVCLVLGVGMPLLAVLWFTLDQDHPARKIGVVLPVVFLLMGLAVLFLGILTMFQVKEELEH